jgi:hypothetical protein
MMGTGGEVLERPVLGVDLPKENILENMDLDGDAVGGFSGARWCSCPVALVAWPEGMVSRLEEGVLFLRVAFSTGCFAREL